MSVITGCGGLMKAVADNAMNEANIIVRMLLFININDIVALLRLIVQMYHHQGCIAGK